MNRIKVFFFRLVMFVPAFVTFGFYALLQIWGGFSLFKSEGGVGVAYGAHLGGFIAALLITKFFVIKKKDSKSA